MKNFTTSWSDGLAFNALIHHWMSQLFDFQNIARKHPNARLEHAFRIAQEHLGIERLLDPEGKLVFVKEYMNLCRRSRHKVGRRCVQRFFSVSEIEHLVLSHW